MARLGMQQEAGHPDGLQCAKGTDLLQQHLKETLPQPLQWTLLFSICMQCVTAANESGIGLKAGTPG